MLKKINPKTNKGNKQIQRFALLKLICAQAGVAQWFERWPANQGVASLIPSQGTCLCCQPGPQWGVVVHVRDTFT